MRQQELESYITGLVASLLQGEKVDNALSKIHDSVDEYIKLTDLNRSLPRTKTLKVTE